MSSIENWNGDVVPVRRSRGGVLTLERWQDNVVRGALDQWPPEALVRQVGGYVGRPAHFDPKDAEALSAQLGKISRFQSINSEDAVTFSWFGTLAGASDQIRRQAVQWLYDRAGIPAAAKNPAIDQWARIPHPNAPNSPSGPELDARIADPGTSLVYVEAKWNASIGKGKGKDTGIPDDQIILRRDALRATAEAVDDTVTLAVLGVSEHVPDLSPWLVDGSRLRPVVVRWLSWDDIADCPVHPCGEEFARYIVWKRKVSLSTATTPE